MNERIKDLLEEAGLVSYGEDTGFYNIPAPAFLSRIDRLAELIVKECAGIADGLSKLYPRTDVGFDVGYTMGTTRATKEIKEHFGVEE